MREKMWKTIHFYQCLTVLCFVAVICIILYTSTPASYNLKPSSETFFWKMKGHSIKTKTLLTYAKTFLAAGKLVGLKLFLAEPDILMDIESGKTKPGLWSARTKRCLTFGVIDPWYKALEELSNLLRTNMGLHRLVINDTERRGVSISSFTRKEKLPIIPMHFLWWSGDEKNQSTLLFHLVIFRSRGDYLWHGQLSPVPLWDETATNNSIFEQSLPFPASDLAIGHHPALIDRFGIQKMAIGNTALSLPENISSFLHSLQDGALVECNHGTAQYLLKHYPNVTLGRDKVRQEMMTILALAVKALDSVGVTFWLSAGTLLGWYRQCDIIPYTSDIDLEMRIEDYVPRIVPAMEAAGLRLWRRLGKLADSFELTFRRKYLLDLFFRYEETNYTYLTMFNQRTFEKYRYIFPKYGLRWTEFGGIRVRVPYPPEAYLEANYGMKWYKPKVHFHWLRGASNGVPFGFWPKKDRKGLKQTFF